MSEKALAKCALNVWQHEDAYRSLIEAIDSRDVEKTKYYLDSLRKIFGNIATNCRVDTKESLEKLEDAEWHVDKREWLDAKWDLLFASSHVLDSLKKVARDI